MTKCKELVQLPHEVIYPLEKNLQDNMEQLYNMKESDALSLGENWERHIGLDAKVAPWISK